MPESLHRTVRKIDWHENFSKTYYPLRRLLLRIAPADDENRTRRIADDALGSTAEHEMFQSGISACGDDDQIDIDLLREPANLFKRPAFYCANIFVAQRT